MKYLSVCAGIEAASVAWHPLGWKPVAFSEIEPFPCAVLAHHYPTVPNLGDMTQYREWPEELLAEVDLIIGGTPCQAFSMAGKRESLDDERGNLTLCFTRLVNHIDEVRKKHGRRATIVVWENVPGVLSTRDNAFGCFLGALSGEDAAISVKKWPRAGVVNGERRRVAWCVLDAQFFGVAQRRRRVFAVAVPGELVAGTGAADPAEILAIGTCLRRDTPKRSETRQGVAGDAEESVGASGFNFEMWSGECKWLSTTLQKCRTSDTLIYASCGQLAPALETTRHEPTRADGFVSICIQGAGERSLNVNGSGLKVEQSFMLNSAEQHAVAFNLQESHCFRAESATTNPLRVNQTEAGAFEPGVMSRYGGHVYDNVSGTLRKEPGDNQISIATGCDIFNGTLTGEVAACITRDGVGRENGTGPRIISEMTVRRLTPRECERLQGFPDDHTLIPWRGSMATDSNRYMALGNSMAVPVVRWIGMRINGVFNGM